MAWTKIQFTGSTPGLRFGQTSLYDSVSNKLMLFAGSSNVPACLNDYWVMSNANTVGGAATWVHVMPTGTLPSARLKHTGVYDSANNRMIMFGGMCGTTYQKDVWVLSNANNSATPAWTKLTPTGTGPSGREAPSAIYNPTSNTMLVFGGDAGGSPFGDLWSLSHANGLGGTSAWTQLSLTGPSARSGQSAVYSSALDTMTIFGGWNGTIVLSETWTLDHVSTTPSWVQGVSGSPRRFHSSDLDPTSGQMLVFGGQTGVGSITPYSGVLALVP